VGQDIFSAASRSHSDTPHSVGLLWTSDSARRRDLYSTTHNTHNRQTDRQTCPRPEANPQSQQASGRTSTTWAARTSVWAHTSLQYVHLRIRKYNLNKLKTYSNKTVTNYQTHVTNEYKQNNTHTHTMNPRVPTALSGDNRHLVSAATCLNPLQPSGHYMYRQFNIQQLYVLPTVYLCVLCGSQNKQRLFPYTTLTDWFV
jgi:hypothetical protein